MLKGFFLCVGLLSTILVFPDINAYFSFFKSSEKPGANSHLTLVEKMLGDRSYKPDWITKENYAQKIKEYYELSERKFEQKDYIGAQADLNRVIQLDPNYAQAYKNRGGVKVILKDYQGALSDYNRAIQLDPGFVNAYNGRGFLKMFALNDYRGSLNDLNRAIKIKPDSVDAYSNLAVLKYVYLKDKPGGINDLQKVVKILQQQGERKRAENAAKTLNEWRSAAKRAGTV
jgi:tetratricopeptide (TPR) repeat protein